MSVVLKAHSCLIGETGYNTHSRNFFKELSSLYQVQARNWTIGHTWKGYTNDEPHNDEYYIDDTLKKILTEQTLGTPSGDQEFPLYTSYANEGKPDVHIILNDNNHKYFYQEYDGKKIAYNVWETTRQPENFFNNLKRFDQVWVPSEWQRKCTIEQGIDENKVKVVPEGVDGNIYNPSNNNSFDKKKTFRFLLVGRWDYRKSIREIIETFTKTFSEEDNVELLISVDNSYATDGLTSTEERLKKFGIKHKGIKIVHHLSKTEYINLLKSANVFISCARSEGWNLPLIEAMACGIPSTYSNWGAQLEFASGKGIPIKIKGEIPAAVDNNESWIKDAPGNFCEPDFDDLSIKLKDIYKNYKKYKNNALQDSEIIREKFSWKNAAMIAKKHIDDLVVVENKNISIEKKYEDDFAFVTCGNIGYMPLIEKLVKSLLEFSNRKILVYGIDCDVPFDYPNVISKKIEIPYYSEHDKWYWKQYACLESLNEEFENLIWMDGDVVVNHNIDNIKKYFLDIDNYPIPDIHVQENFIGYYTDKDGSSKKQLFNENVYNKYSVGMMHKIAHICMYVYNKKCGWWFDEILKTYRETPLEDYKKLLQWNDEGIDNLLRSIHGFGKFLPISNFDVSSWDGTILSNGQKAMEHFLQFWKSTKPKNFGHIYGWQRIPKDKSNIIYFHGNKNLEFADIMTDFIKTKRDNNFEDTTYFYVGDNEIKNLGSIKGVEGGTLDIAKTYGWDYAIYHEIYNLKDYEWPRPVEDGHMVKVKPGDNVVDLGGNIGIFTRYAHQCGANKIITFEPDKRYFKLLKQNAPKNSILFNAAISDKVGKMILTESEHLGGSNLWAELNPLQNQYEVNTYTLDYILENGLIPKIDFLKVDIEGSEIIALNGISDDNLRNIRNIAVEYHHEHLKFDELVRLNFVSRLTNLGFNSFTLFCGTDNALQLLYFWK